MKKGNQYLIYKDMDTMNTSINFNNEKIWDEFSLIYRESPSRAERIHNKEVKLVENIKALRPGILIDDIQFDFYYDEESHLMANEFSFEFIKEQGGRRIGFNIEDLASIQHFIQSNIHLVLVEDIVKVSTIEYSMRDQ